jgi:mono/diheme cytochrome c family protein
MRDPESGAAAADRARRPSDPAAVDPNAEMPAFAGKLSDVQIHAIAAYLAQRK